MATKAIEFPVTNDKIRFDWFFGNNDKAKFLLTYFIGMREGWSPDQWRLAIDEAIAREKQPNLCANCNGTGEVRVFHNGTDLGTAICSMCNGKEI